MERFVHRRNPEHYRKLLAETTDEAQRRVLLKLIAEEEAKDRKPINWRVALGLAQGVNAAPRIPRRHS
jgi:hypothetical protein